MRVLVLAGAAEARRLADAMSAAGIAGLASLSGATERPHELALPTRTGGFGGAEGFLAVLRSEGIGAVVDATHPFAARITERTARLCREEGIPCLRLERPGWTAGEGDAWTRVAEPEAAARLIPVGARVFLATGQQSLEAFDLPGRQLFLRVIDPPKGAFPVEGGRYVVGRPPFTEDSETALFSLLGIDWLVVKNSGGEGGRAKLDAARALGLPVLMIDRPPRPEVETVSSVEAAMAWIEALE